MLGMVLAHFGVAVFVCGVPVTESNQHRKDVRLGHNETVMLGAYTFRFDGVAHTEGPNFKADQGTITVTRNDSVVAVLHPQKRQYSRNAMTQTESDIDPGLTRDLYVALGEPLGQRWSSVGARVSETVCALDLAGCRADDAGRLSLQPPTAASGCWSPIRRASNGQSRLRCWNCCRGRCVNTASCPLIGFALVAALLVFGINYAQQLDE